MRRDGNHVEIVRDLRRVGISVQETHEVGSGFPDLVWGFMQVTGLLELKVPGAELEPHQRDFADAWRGAPILVARGSVEAIDVIQRAVRARR